MRALPSVPFVGYDGGKPVCILLQSYAEIREIDPLSVIVPISKIRKPHLPIGLNIWNTLYRVDVPSKKWFRIVFREDQPSTKEQPEGAREPE